MASNYTSNYGLCQWEPGDAFVRTEFNGDNAKVDGALQRLTEHGARTDWNLYNLLLRDYYEGKHTGWKKALIFDGFLEKPAYDQLTEGFFWSEAEHCLSLDGVVQQDTDLFYGTNYGKSLAPGESASLTWAALGSGKLDNIQTYVTGGGDIRISLLRLDGSNVITITYGADGVFTLRSGGTFIPRGIYIIQLVNVSNRTMTMYGANTGQSFGAKVTMYPHRFTTGTYTGVSVDPKFSLRRAQGWVRHHDGSVRLFLCGEGRRIELPMAATGQGTLPNGGKCQETSFSLALPEELSGPVQIQVELAGEENRMTQIRDAGVALA